MARVHAISIVLGLVAGASWAVGSAMRPDVQPALDPGVARELVAADARAHWTAVEARSAELAALPRLAAAVATDAATVRDLTPAELAFRVAPREAVELGQVHGGRAVSLLRAPETAPPVPLARLGRWLSVADRELRFTAIASIVPIQDATAMRGAVAVSTAAPPEVALQRLAARTAGRLVVDGAPIDIAGGISEGGATIEVLLDELPGAPKLILPAAISAPPLAHALRGLALAALLAGLGVAIAMRGRARRAAASAGSAGSSASSAHRTTSPGVAVGVAAGARAGRPTGGGHLPARIGSYAPISLLGQGGMSSVYLARAGGGGDPERPVALKVLRLHLARNPRARAMFLDEARVVACIDHPHVIRIFDLGYAEDQIYIAMEHLDGGDLESHLIALRAEGRRVPVEIAVAILQRICAGLHAAHTATDLYERPLHVVHRDVKPGNVLVSAGGAVKVSDFGMAKARQQVHTSLLGEARGTAAFMAPEQRLGQGVDPRTDVFGVAAIGYELLAGLEIDLDLARLQPYGTAGWPHLPPLREVRPEVPPALEQLLFRGLAFSPDDRHASCAELAAELARVAAEAGWSAGEPELAAWVRGELARRPQATQAVQAA